MCNIGRSVLKVKSKSLSFKKEIASLQKQEHKKRKPIENNYTCSKGVMDAVKGDGIDWVNMLDSILLKPVALESILLLLNFLAWVQILHGYTAFD